MIAQIRNRPEVSDIGACTWSALTKLMVKLSKIIPAQRAGGAAVVHHEAEHLVDDIGDGGRFWRDGMKKLLEATDAMPVRQRWPSVVLSLSRYRDRQLCRACRASVEVRQRDRHRGSRRLRDRLVQQNPRDTRNEIYGKRQAAAARD